MASASILCCPAAYNFDNAPITPTTAPVPIIAPSEIAAGPIAFLSFNVDGYDAFFCTINIVLIEVIAPTTNINGKNIGHIASEILVIICSNFNKKSISNLFSEMEKKERKGFTFKGIIDKIYIGYK